MGQNSEDVRGAQQLAEVLLRDLDRIVERSVARMQEQLPSFGQVPAARLTPVTSTNTRNLLEAIRGADADPTRAEDLFQVSGETWVGQGIAADEMFQGWRIWLDVVREEARPVAARLGMSDDALLEFVEATMQWGGTLFSAAVAEVSRLAEEQAALRRVAELVAREAAQKEIFTAIAAEIGRLLDADEMWMLRYEGETEAVVVARTGAHQDVFPVGTHWPLGGDNVTSRVFATEKPARIEDYEQGEGLGEGLGGDLGGDLGGGLGGDPITDAARAEGLGAVVGVPILVRGRLWGAMMTGTFGETPLPPDTESGLGKFTELLGIAIANAEARGEVEALAEEQAALRRVATLVATETPPSEVFAKVADEVARVFGDAQTSMFRDEGDGTATVIALHGVDLAVGTRLPTDGNGVIATAMREARPISMGDDPTKTGAIAVRGRDLGIRSAIGCPVVVRGRVWGALGAARRDRRPFPTGSEMRLARFADLVATAIANAGAREEVARLAEEQAALRRVAMLVAQGASPSDVFGAVAAEMGTLLDADGITLVRYEPDDELTVMAHGGQAMSPLPTGTRIRHDGASVSATVRRTQRPARMASYADTHGQIGEVIGGLRLHSGVGAPIVVDGRLWGATIANWVGDESAPPDTEDRMARFAQLLDTAIANADSRDQLMASRARLVTAADDARRRVVRDLHDGAQQRLVHTVVMLKLAKRALRDKPEQVESLIDAALEHGQLGAAELRELAHGILPAALTDGGLRAGITTVVERVGLPVEVNVPAQRFRPEIEASAYFIIAEALTNVVKHSHATRATITARADDRTLQIEVRDDGIGGADPGGHGLIGLRDRATALGGQFRLTSTPGSGTVVSASLPVLIP